MGPSEQPVSNRFPHKYFMNSEYLWANRFLTGLKPVLKKGPILDGPLASNVQPRKNGLANGSVVFSIEIGLVFPFLEGILTY
jgi:hypothetical protein